MKLKTPQTPPEGILVRNVWVEEASAIDRELYLSMTLDRVRSTHVVMASQAGGMDIEEVAERTPEKILREWTHPALGLADFQARRLAFGLGLSGESFKQGDRADPQPLPALPRQGLLAGRDQPAGRHQGRPRAGARRQAELRRQRALSPPGDRRAARHPRGGPARRRGLEVQPELHQARRRRGVHGQRRRPGHGHHGHRQAVGRRAGELPGRRRRRLARADRERLPHPVVRPQREGRLHQRVRRHPACRPAGRGHHRRGAQARAHAPGGAARRGHQRRAGQEDARRVRPAPDHGRRHGRRRAQGRGAGAEGLRRRERPRRPEHARGRAGHHRQGGRVPRRAVQGVRHARSSAA